MYTPRAERRRQIVVFLGVLHHLTVVVHLYCVLRHLVRFVVRVGHAGAGGHASCADGEVCACRGGRGEGWFGGVDEGVTGYVCDV